jgi:chemotaxis signal transduction protein
MRDNDVLPVYDLALRLHCEVRGESMLCMVARHKDGPLAICIDGEVPSLRTLDAAEIRPAAQQELETLGSFESDGESISIVALNRLGTQASVGVGARYVE